MTQRVRNGLGLPAGLYRTNNENPTFFVPNGITADGIESLVYANVVPVSGGNYDLISYDSNADLFVPAGNPQPSPTHFNDEIASFASDVLWEIWIASHSEGDFPYKIVASESRVNIVDDLAAMKADFILEG